MMRAGLMDDDDDDASGEMGAVFIHASLRVLEQPHLCANEYFSSMWSM